MGDDSPQISSVMLCWNRLTLSRRTLDSYLQTISVPHELFVIDNASTDGTKEWVASLREMNDVTDVLFMERNDPAAALNQALERCTGKFLHIMENDYEYLQGWDRYVLDRFARIPQLGQLAPVVGHEYYHGDRHQGLVFLARDNVCSTSVFRRELFFDTGVRLKGTCRNRFPDDYDLSMQIRRAGWLVAWSDVEIAHHLGLDADEHRRDPTYYIRDYTLKLFDLPRLRGQARRWLHLDFHDTATLAGRLLRAISYRLRDRSDGVR